MNKTVEAGVSIFMCIKNSARMATVVMLALLTSCSVLSPRSSTVEDAPIETETTRPEILEDYKISVGDEIALNVFDNDPMTNTYIVSTNGSVSLPLIGNVRAQGLTVDEFIAAAEEGLRFELINSPRVSAQIVGFRPIYVLGEVKQPGGYEFNFDMNIYGAIALAGGYSFRAHRDYVFIRRAGSTDESRYTISPSLMVRPGDTIRIDQRSF